MTPIAAPLAALAIALIAPAAAHAAETLAESCDASKGRAATVRDVDSRLELTLDAGTRVRLVGVEAPRAPAAARDAMRRWLVGREVRWLAATQAPDRWGRHEGFIAAPVAGAAAPMSVAEAILDAGYARALAEASMRPCAEAFYAAEARARRERLGVWADAWHAVLPAADRKAFAGRGGDVVVVEGTVVGAGETRWRIYLNFGPIRTVDFAVSIPRRALKLFEEAGLRPADLAGEKLRVRGLLDTRFGPQIELAEPAAIEFVAPEGPPPHSRPLAER